MSRYGVKALLSSRTVAFTVLAFAFAYGAGWSGTSSVSVLQSNGFAHAFEMYGPMDAASPTEWRTPYPDTVWANGKPLDKAPVPVIDAEDREFDL